MIEFTFDEEAIEKIYRDSVGKPMPERLKADIIREITRQVERDNYIRNEIEETIYWTAKSIGEEYGQLKEQ